MDIVLKKEDSTTDVSRISKMVIESEPEVQRDPLMIPGKNEEYITKVLTTGMLIWS